MLCLHRYWLKEFFKYFGIIQMIVLVLFVIIDYLSRLDKFLNSDLSLFGAMGYVLLKLPFMFVQLTPASILLSSIVVFALMNRNNELLAIRAGGISIYCFAKPVLAAGGVLALAIFLLGESLIPVTMSQANYIDNHILKKRKGYHSVRQDVWIRSDDKMVHINFFDPQSQTISGVTITALDRNFQIQFRIDAEKGAWKEGAWVFENLVEQHHDQNSGDYVVARHSKKQLPLSFKPEDLGEITRKSDEMSFGQLRRYVAKVEQEGYNARIYKVDLYAKLAYPFICIVMVLTGAAAGIRSFVKDNLPLAIAFGLGVTFFYWVMYGFCLSLGYGGVLPPLLSAWTANIFFLSAGVLYLVNNEQ